MQIKLFSLAVVAANPIKLDNTKVNGVANDHRAINVASSGLLSRRGRHVKNKTVKIEDDGSGKTDGPAKSRKQFPDDGGIFVQSG
ncbi:hypothetical protein MBANPS3_002102 [Mucor bainieri]